jgi:hypothetical protein
MNKPCRLFVLGGVGGNPLRNRSSSNTQIEFINQLDVLPFPACESVYIPPVDRSFSAPAGKTAATSADRRESVVGSFSVVRPATLTAGFSPTGGTLQGISADD